MRLSWGLRHFPVTPLTDSIFGCQASQHRLPASVELFPELGPPASQRLPAAVDEGDPGSLVLGTEIHLQGLGLRRGAGGMEGESYSPGRLPGLYGPPYLHLSILPAMDEPPSFLLLEHDGSGAWDTQGSAAHGPPAGDLRGKTAKGHLRRLINGYALLDGGNSDLPLLSFFSDTPTLSRVVNPVPVMPARSAMRAIME